MLGSRHGATCTSPELACMHPPDTECAPLHTRCTKNVPIVFRTHRPATPVRAAAARPPLAHALIISSSLVSYFGSVAWTIWLG